MTPPTGPQLRDIHLPAEPGWWPPAPGWWVLAALVLLAAVLLWRAWARRRSLARERTALVDEFDALLRRHPDSAGARIADISLFLRRAGKRYAPAAHALRDEDWLRFLDADDPARPFSTGAGRILIDGPYRPHVAPAEVDALADAVRARLPAFVTRDARAARAPRKQATPMPADAADV